MCHPFSDGRLYLFKQSIDLMRNASFSAIIYYTLVIATTIVSLYFLFGFLNWPLLAEVPLGVSIFLQVVFLSRKLFNFWARQEKYSFADLGMKVRDALFSRQSTSKESSNSFQ
jgi:hypothetical protein